MKNYLSYGKLDSKCIHIAGLDEQDLNPDVRQSIVNDIIMDAYGLLDGVNHPFWNRTISVTVAGDNERLKDNVTNGGTITAVNSTTKNVTRNAGVFVAGSLLDIVIVAKATSLGVGQWKARVTIGGATATYENIDAGTEATFVSADHVCFINVMRKLSASSGDISSQYVKKVVKVYDDQDTGSKQRVFYEKKDARKFGNLHNDPSEAKYISWYHNGNTIDFFVGASATALGIVQAEVIAKPALYTDATKDNEVDFDPEMNKMLTDQIVAEYMKKAGKGLPQDLESRLATYPKRAEAAQGDQVKELETKGR